VTESSCVIGGAKSLKGPLGAATAHLTVGAALPLLALLGSLVLAACGQGQVDPFQVDIRLSPTPPLVGDARVIVAVRDSVGVPVSGASVVVSAAPVESGTESRATASEEGAGSYIAGALAFDAAGEWTVAATVDGPEGRHLRVAQRIRVSGKR